MKIYIGADHRGFNLKKKIAVFLEKKGFSVEDFGTYKRNPPCDYPLISHDVARAVAHSRSDRGILVCMTGLGHAIAANKIPGVRAALCYNKRTARLSRAHNDANILVVGAKFVRQKDIEGIIAVWLKTEFDGGRHRRRVDQIKKIEKEFSKK